MAKFNATGINDYVAELQKLGNETDNIIGQAVFKGAEVVADAVHSEIANLPKESCPSDRWRQGLLDGLGIAKMKNENGVKNVKIGFNGYSSPDKYGKAQPIPMIARMICKGTSATKKNNFVKNAARRIQSDTEKAMKTTIEDKINSLTK